MSWKTLSNDEQRAFAKNCVQRRRSYEAFLCHGKVESLKRILLIADQPGPGAPQTDEYHHTPFYAKTHSGGWLNALLVKAGIDETRLFWDNAAKWDGVVNSTAILHAKNWTQILALGGNAEKWIRKNGFECLRFDHPQYHKRWKSKESYPLIQHLTEVLNGTKTQDAEPT